MNTNNASIHHHRRRDRAPDRSRPPDPRWDVSGDGSVTSLDALMILQAAAGSIEID
jgi:hypothetical protein